MNRLLNGLPSAIAVSVPTSSFAQEVKKSIESYCHSPQRGHRHRARLSPDKWQVPLDETEVDVRDATRSSSR